MAARILTFLAVVATGMLALRAFAHEVGCRERDGAAWRTKVVCVAR